MTDATQPGSQPRLRRVLGVWDLIFYGMVLIHWFRLLRFDLVEPESAGQDRRRDLVPDRLRLSGGHDERLLASSEDDGFQRIVVGPL